MHNYFNHLKKAMKNLIKVKDHGVTIDDIDFSNSSMDEFYGSDADQLGVSLFVFFKQLSPIVIICIILCQCVAK